MCKKDNRKLCDICLEEPAIYSLEFVSGEIIEACENCDQNSDHFFFCNTCGKYEYFDDGHYTQYRIIDNEIICLSCAIQAALSGDIDIYAFRDTETSPVFMNHQISESAIIAAGFKLDQEINESDPTKFRELYSDAMKIYDPCEFTPAIVTISHANIFYAPDRCKIWIKGA